MRYTEKHYRNCNSYPTKYGELYDFEVCLTLMEHSCYLAKGALVKTNCMLYVCFFVFIPEPLVPDLGQSPGRFKGYVSFFSTT